MSALPRVADLYDVWVERALAEAGIDLDRDIGIRVIRRRRTLSDRDRRREPIRAKADELRRELAI